MSLVLSLQWICSVKNWIKPLNLLILLFLSTEQQQHFQLQRQLNFHEYSFCLMAY